MDIYEQMQSGQYYSTIHPQLMKERKRAKALCHRFNHLHPSRYRAKEKLIRKLFGETGNMFWIEQPLHCDYGSHIYAKDGLIINHHCVLLDAAPIRFGTHVMIAPNCGFYTVGHPLDSKLRAQELEFCAPITVGDHVWFGAGVTVLPGVTIGSHTVIGAGSVVSKDIPSGVLAVGNPCKVIRRLTPEEEVTMG